LWVTDIGGNDAGAARPLRRHDGPLEMNERLTAASGQRDIVAFIDQPP